MADLSEIVASREKVRRFEALTAPLTGTMLIDASAGTGKTYTIAALVVRLLLERGLELPDILVVTFTEAAAEDLRGRIRQGIRKAAQAFAIGHGEDAFQQGLLAAWPDHDRAAARLDLVLRNFDEAAVFTIHGFCQRVLAEHSLETGILFDSELVTDLRETLRRIVEDYFRTSFYGESPLVVGYCLKLFSPELLRKRMGNLYDREDMEVRPQLDGAALRQGLAEAEGDYRAAFARCARVWPARSEPVRKFLLESPGLNRKKYGKKSLPTWLAALESILALVEPPSQLFEKFEKFTSDCLREGMNKGCEPPDEPFFAHCGEVLAAHGRFAERLDQYALWLEAGLFAYVRRELRRSKEENGVHSFDDLLTKLCLALRGAGGPSLAANLRGKYRAALIDEFQDTDPVQYEIFTSAFNHPDSLLYLIGDPKQAIYSFRGADIFAYIRAVRDIGARYTLIDNWRSVPGLIAAVNTLFAGTAQPFVFPEIDFSPACPAEKNHTQLLLGGVEEKPFLIRGLQRPEGAGDNKPLSKEAAGQVILLDLAAEIARLLELARQGKAFLAEKPLAAGDIAVLVRTNRQARQVQAALAEVGIASVLNSSESLFASREAAEVGILLRAVAECGNGRRVRAALATRLLAVPAAALDLCLEEAPLDGRYERFRLYHDLWESGGFVRMFGEFLDGEGVRERLLALTGGERVLTNVLHLQEVLHAAATRQKLGMSGLLKYLHDLIAAADDNPAEELQLRLASDAELVQIITIHKAKGLQYPVVFCPFSWEGSQILGREKPSGSGALGRYLFHEQAGTEYRLVLDLGSGQVESREQALREELAESLRLLYVALTRAINRCYLYWGPFASAGTSAAAYLLHGSKSTSESGSGQWGVDFMAGLTDAALVADLHELSRRSAGNVEVEMLDAVQAPRVLRKGGEAIQLDRRIFHGQCRDDWRVESFSSLHRAREASLLGARPMWSVATTVESESGPGDENYFADLANFPAGPGPGTFLHSLLEEADFGESPEGWLGFLREKLRVAGFDLRWAPVLATMLDDLLHTPLTPAEPALTLAGVSNNERISELEFYFPLAAADPGRLDNYLAEALAVGFDRPSPLLTGKYPEGLRGMMKGYIDLVFQYGGRFYLLDWKSNHLGSTLADYAVNRLPEVMKREGYTLQYLIYTVALHRYLGQRVSGYNYEQHFGGVFYLFLRGVQRRAGCESGIFRARPESQLVEELSAYLGDA